MPDSPRTDYRELVERHNEIIRRVLSRDGLDAQVRESAANAILQAHEEIRALQADRDAAEARVAELTTWMRKYEPHEAACATGYGPSNACDCGMGRLLGATLGDQG